MEDPTKIKTNSDAALAARFHQTKDSLILSPRNVYIERIDSDHANAKRLWIEVGKPALPTERKVEPLHVASQVVRGPPPWEYQAGTLRLKFTVLSQAIAAITVELTPKPPKGSLDRA